MKGLNYYDELKKRPKLLKYTIDKLKSKEYEEIEERKNKMETLEVLKNDIKQISN